MNIKNMSDKDKKRKILEFMNEPMYKPMPIRALAGVFSVPKTDRALFQALIYSLKQGGKIGFDEKQNLVITGEEKLYKGVYYANWQGFGFVKTEETETGDFFIPVELRQGAIHMDEVMCRPVRSDKGGRRTQGEIVSVIKHNIVNIVGTYESYDGFKFVVPDNKKINQDICITKINGQQQPISGQKVVAVITKYTKNSDPHEGEIVEILGQVNEPGVDILSIVKSYNIPTDFKENTKKEASEISDVVQEKDMTGRRDLRATPMVTIDGEDTKDIDDAVSLEILPNGNYSLGVHIADVTNYVKEGSPLDVEADRRGTSVYLADRVIPMLPEELSNGICSLNAGVDRLALSCIMEINEYGRVLDHDIAMTIINVDRRMTYTVVNDLLVNEESKYTKEYEDFAPMFKTMETLAKALRAKRVEKGSIEFDFPEVRIILDTNGKPIDIKPYHRNVATGIIEEFMIACNETIGEAYSWLEIPFVYRCHEAPKKLKMQALRAFLASYGFAIKGSGNHPRSVQQLLAKIEKEPEEMAISKIILRSMNQAYYTQNNVGHFGLASKFYSHFTSPIRRYPDLQIHRIIKEHLLGEIQQRIDHYNEILPEVCLQCSQTERVADRCAREVETYKKLEFMSDKIGETYDAVISGVISRGIFVELENTAEGMITISKLVDDEYEFYADRMRFVGRRSKKTYALGDRVKVILEDVNLGERTMDFDLVRKLKH